jgi:hypothetical protein
VRERPPLSGISYTAAIDPASGGGPDSMTLAIGHRDNNGRGILDCVREAKPPFSPSAVVQEFKQTLAAYSIYKLTGDRWGGSFVHEPFLPIRYELAEQPKSDFYRDVLPLINSSRIELLDLPRIAGQLCTLERKTARSGKDSIDHAPGAHDDVANAVAMCLVQAVGHARWWENPALQRALGVGAPAPPAVRPDVVWHWGQLPSMSTLEYVNDPRRRGFRGW